MPKRKIVGITCSGGKAGAWQLPTDYARIAYSQACEQAGLLPVLLPITENDAVRQAQLDAIDGLLLTGGDDIHPRFYGVSELHPLTEAIEERRDDHEIALVQAAVARDLPLLGICRGLQVLNVALGGTLHQHIAGHSQEPDTTLTTECAAITQNSRLSRILGGVETLRINSHHHQAASEIAPSLTVTARAEDGTIEALELLYSRFVLAVQWHPENLYLVDPAARALFAAFAEAL